MSNQPILPMKQICLCLLICGLMLRFMLCSAQGHPAEVWEQVAPASRNDTLLDLVTDGMTHYVLTDDESGAVLRSVDGVHFVREPLGVPGAGPNEALLFHDGQWHAVRGGVLYRKSSLGLWETVPEAPLRIVGMTSIEGVLWAWTFGGFDHTGGDPLRVLPQLWRKLDASPWTKLTVTDESLPPVDYSSLIRQNGLFVLTGNGFDFDLERYTGGVWTSSDGVSWAVSAYGDYRGMAWNGSRFVGGSTSGRVTFSDDGIHWFRVPFPFISGYLDTDPVPSAASSITWFNNAFWVVTGIFGKPILAKSADGTEWTEVTSGQIDTERAPVQAIRLLGGVPYFLGAQGYLWHTADWEISRERLLPVEPWHWRAVAANASQLIAVGENGRVASSTDGLGFSYSNIGVAAVPERVVWLESAQKFISIGRNSAGAVVSWSTSDGVVWLESSVGSWPAGPLGLAAGNDGVVICGPEGRLAFSGDGATWLSVASGTTADLSEMAFGGNRWVAAGVSGSAIYSADRVIWQSFSRPPNPRMVWNQGVWFFSDPVGQMSFTTDFSEWSDVGASLLPAVDGLTAAFGEIFGNEGRFLTSSSDAAVWTFRSEVNPASSPNRILLAGVRFLDRLYYVGMDGRIHRSGAWRDFYFEWRQSKFPIEQRDNDAISGPMADPDRDGASNLVEWACGLNPIIPDTRWHISFEPELRSFHYPRVNNLAGVSLWSEYSEDLVHWRRTGQSITATLDDFDPVVSQVWSSPIDTNLPRGYFRLRATRVFP